MKTITIILTFLTISIAYSQEELKKAADDFLIENNNFHNLHQEKFYLHTNKTTYYSGEKIWFKAYAVYDISDTPIYKTSNLYVNLYNSDKKIISHQLLFTENGTAHGKIELPYEIVSGNYYIELDTQWNGNFNNQNVTPIQVINLATNDFVSINSNQNTSNTNKLDIQFYPESGVLLERVENIITFTTKIGNNPVFIEGKIIDNETEREITKFKSNDYGFGSFKLVHYPNRQYIAHIKLTGLEEQITLPLARQKGIIIHKKTEQKNPNTISFSLKTNKATLTTEANKIFFVVLHRKGYVRTVIPIKLESEYHNYSFDLEKKHLFNGVNTITLFNKKNQPITERNFYCKKDKIIDLKITEVSSIDDTLTIDFNMLNKFTKANLSVSVLPSETKVYNNNGNILSDFLIKPYLNKNSHYLTKYFDKNETPEDIDLILQTQTNINSLPNKGLTKSNSKFDIETGVTIKGNVQSKISELQLYNFKVMLTSEKNNLLLLSDIKKNNSFEFDSLLLKHPSSYKLALIDNNGKVLKAGFNVNKEFVKYKADSILEYHDANNEYLNNNHFETSGNFMSKPKDVEELGEVVVTAKIERFDTEFLLPNPKVLGNTFTKTYQIKEDMYSSSGTMLDAIGDQPGVHVNLLSKGGPTIDNNRGKRHLHPGAEQNMAVFLDGIRIHDLVFFREMPASSIETIEVNKTGAGYGIIGSDGVINITTKKGFSKKNIKKQTNTNQIVSQTEFGFSMSTENYENFPLDFPDENSKIFFSTITWIPNFSIHPNVSNYLKINKSDYENIKLIINGFNENGDLIFKEINIPTAKNY